MITDCKLPAMKMRSEIRNLINSSAFYSGFNCNEVQEDFLMRLLGGFYEILNSPPAAADTPSNDSQSS